MQNLQSFTDVGTFQHHVSFGHMGIAVNFTLFRHRLHVVQKLVTHSVDEFMLST